MHYTHAFFDLDGTLLPMDQDVFVKAYFGGISKRLAPLGYEPQALIGAIWSGTAAMVKNNGEVLNEVPTAVVGGDSGAISRALTRSLDASPKIDKILHIVLR